MRPGSGFLVATNQPKIEKNNDDATICRHDIFIKYFEVSVSLLSSSDNGLGFTSMS